MNAWHRALRANDSGAIAPLYALALFALVGAAGLGFDYARLASLDTELQNAADQAALAGVTQLDGSAGATGRATSAAQGGLVQNSTLLANDGGLRSIAVPTVLFYETKGDAEAGSNPTTDDTLAYFIRVRVEVRTANYALTPVIGAFGGDAVSEAVAGLGSAICKVPPVMMCNPSEPNNNTNPNYPFTASQGDGIRLVIGNPDAPGNFGFLQTGFGTGAQALARAIGYNTPPGACAPTGTVDTEPGDKQSVRAALNTRFDMSEAGQTCPAGGTCSPSRNARKDLVRGNNCSTSGNQAWQEAPDPYRPDSANAPLASDGSEDPDIMGYPRDMCHAVSLNGLCGGGIIGDGAWDISAYFRVNYGWNSASWQGATGLSASASRYDVYSWELDNPVQADMVQNVGGNKNGYSYPVCRSPGITPDVDTPDRRRLSVAVINCDQQNLAGREFGVTVHKWVDVFLVEPSFQRGNGPSARSGNGDIYVELIGETAAGANGEVAGQVVRRDVPYLIR